MLCAEKSQYTAASFLKIAYCAYSVLRSAKFVQRRRGKHTAEYSLDTLFIFGLFSAHLP